jgi:hypothetical protein
MVTTSKQSIDNWKIEGLAAAGPDPKLSDKLMLFGQFIGDWDIKSRYLEADGSWIPMRGQVHFGWILGGLAIQDVWMGCLESEEKMILFGTTIRFYDPKIDAWRSTWLSPLRGLVQLFIGRKVNDEIVLDLQNTEGFPQKWIFSEITPTSFRWRSKETRDNGKTWSLTEEMQIRKAKRP